ncbi:MAG: asparagine synthase (glutamine-hydrolyzing) [Bacteroidia bacterium]
MCRIGGVWFDGLFPNGLQVMQRMSKILAHGGPDDEGIWQDPQTPFFLLHRRLSIIDLSPLGHQPMVFSPWVISYNGEVYNYKEIRRALEAQGYHFESSSDTEVILKAWHAWGPQALEKFRGMWAMALWNTQDQELILIRDRVGVKPLYYGFWQGNLIFASEIKAFFAFPGFSPSINPHTLSYYLRYGVSHAPQTIYQEVSQLPPATYAVFKERKLLSHQTYWSSRKYFFMTRYPPLSEALAHTEALLKESFSLRLVADVPVGIFLSGGLDSSLVAAFLQKERTEPLRTFTIGFEDAAFDEAPYARKIAQHLGTQHTEYYFTERDLLALVEKIPHWYDEPYADSSALPTYIVCALAKEQVKVVLSADGGDELLAGYERHLRSLQLLRFASYAARLMPEWAIKFYYRLPPPLRKIPNFAEKIYKLQRFDKNADIHSFLHHGISGRTLEKWNLIPLPYTQNPPGDDLNARLYVDFTHYLPDDLLTKVDRVSMAQALEVREPYLDHNLVAYLASLPAQYKVRRGQTKWLIRQILARYLPEPLWNRPKQGFAIPLQKWLDTTLRSSVYEILFSTDVLPAMGIDIQAVKTYVEEFYAGEKGHFRGIWYLYVLGLWWDLHKKRVAQSFVMFA